MVIWYSLYAWYVPLDRSGAECWKYVDWAHSWQYVSSLDVDIRLYVVYTDMSSPDVDSSVCIVYTDVNTPDVDSCMNVYTVRPL